VLAAAALAVFPAVQDIRFWWLALGLGVLGCVLLTLALVARSGAGLGWALTALGAEYTILFVAEGTALDRATPAYAAGFVFVAELAFWSIERRVPAWSEPTLVEVRLARLVGTCALGAVVAMLVLVLSAASGGGGILLESLGVAAAVAALGVLAVLVRRFSLR
jgi:hypothetical protein